MQGDVVALAVAVCHIPLWGLMGGVEFALSFLSVLLS